jgi:Peptidase C13 family
MPLTIEDLRRKLRHRVETENREFATKSVHLLERALKKGTTIRIGPHQYDVANDAFLVVIDEAPGAFWTHPVRYELHDVATGEVRAIPEKYPIESPEINAELVPVHIPDLPWLKKETDRDFPKASPIDLGKLDKQLANMSFGVQLAQCTNRYALFFAGMDNMPHFHTDFVIMRELLINRYGYDPANILISMGNGTGYADLPVDFAGDIPGFEAALDAFAAGGSHPLGAGDALFLFTFNHGGADAGGAFLCMGPAWGTYHSSQLKAKLDSIHCGQLIVAMNQCESGGFISDVIATTGPAQVAIMTACRGNQSAYPSGGGGSHGYLAAALAVALNWAFPTGVTASFPGYSAGAITAQDANNDGLVSAEEAWHYVQDMMTANHAPTIAGNETPQWGVSSAGVAANLFWGQPSVLVQDGVPWWESPDVYLHDPTIVPDDTTAVVGNPANWGDYYHPDAVNRVVACVHNGGCAPARNLTVEFRVMSFGTGGGTTLIDTYPINNIDPGYHAFAYVDWYFSSALIHRCVMVRADCAGDPAQPFGSPIDLDDNQAQRNLDPLFGHFGAAAAATQVIERTFRIGNPGLREAVFTVVAGKGRETSEFIRPVLPKEQEWQKIALKPKEQKELKIRFEISPKVQRGQKLHFPLEVMSLDPDKRSMGGVSFTIEIADGRLEGHLVNRDKIVPKAGTVTIKNTKQTNLNYSSPVGPRGRFSFLNIVPGPYEVSAKCGKLAGRGSVFVAPNRVTTKTLSIESIREPLKA